MDQNDWAKKYAAMDKRIEWKYEQLPAGEQVGKRPEAVDASEGSSIRKYSAR
jgi:hypothetical protein